MWQYGGCYYVNFVVYEFKKEVLKDVNVPFKKRH